jgi:hypothetical protein
VKDSLELFDTNSFKENGAYSWYILKEGKEEK